jgi:uncharacterized repeat protein (TIGR02543 family)
VDGVSAGAVTGYTFYAVTEDHTISAVFATEGYTLTVTAGGNGGVSRDPDQAVYAPGSGVTLTAIADPGWVFTGWSGDLSGSANPAVITMDGDKDITATFARVDTIKTFTFAFSLPNPSSYGQRVAFVALVLPDAWGSGMPSGTVTFKEGETILGTGTLNWWGLATFSTSSLSVGTHSITAVYNGNDTFTGSSSPAFTQRVNKASVTVKLTSSANPSTTGQPVTFTATLSVKTPGSGTPTGTVTFKEGCTTLGTVVVDGTGQASYTTGSLSPGVHFITAVYSGDDRFNGNASLPRRQGVMCG